MDTASVLPRRIRQFLRMSGLGVVSDTGSKAPWQAPGDRSESVWPLALPIRATRLSKQCHIFIEEHLIDDKAVVLAFGTCSQDLLRYFIHLIILMNWHVLGEPLGPPAKAVAGSWLRAHQCSTFLRVLNVIRSWQDIPAVFAGDLGRAATKMENVNTTVIATKNIAVALHHDLDPYCTRVDGRPDHHPGRPRRDPLTMKVGKLKAGGLEAALAVNPHSYYVQSPPVVRPAPLVGPTFSLSLPIS